MTMTNAEWCIKNGIQFRKVGRRPCSNSDYESIGYHDINGYFHECYKGKRLGDITSQSILTWLDMEHKEPILDDVEKRYLSAVIKPFRKDTKCIEMYSDDNLAYIAIFVNSENGIRNTIELPMFKKGTMYKGMKANWSYSLYELGL